MIRTISFLIIITLVGCTTDSSSLQSSGQKAIVQMDIFEAVKYNNVEQVKSWIAKKNKINQTDPDGNTPLHYAVSKNNLAIVQMLIDAGADQNIKNNNRETAIDIAQRNNSIEITDLLIDKMVKK